MGRSSTNILITHMIPRFSFIHLGHSVFFNILVAGAYFVFGLLGLELAVSPSHAGSLWPPAGIALASTLMLGNRILPGVFIGNFLIGAYAFGFDSQSLPIYLTTGTGAAIHALAGAYLIKRIVGFPTPLLEDQHIILFLLLGGPITCLLPATFGISAMAAYHLITATEIPLNWFSWWIGDSIGVVVFTPLLLTLFGTPKPVWRQRFVPVGLPLIVSYMLVSAFFSHIQQIEQQQQEQIFNNQSQVLSEALKHRLQDQIQIIYGIRNLLTGISGIDAEDFVRYTRPLLKQFDELESLQWKIYKPENIRENAFEIKFSEQKKFASQSMPNKPERQIELWLNPKNSDDIVVARIDSSKDSLFINVPVYKKTTKGDTLLGIVTSIVSLPRLIQEAFGSWDSGDIRLTITGSDSNAGFSIIYSNAFENTPAYGREFPMVVAAQQWQVFFYPNPIVTHANIHWSIWWFLISGLLFTSLMGLGLLLLTGRYFRTEKIVNERTADLLQAKNAAESANKTKDQFLAKISHELRTPLNGIMGFTQLLRKNSNLNERERHQIEIISHCSEDLLNLINDILDISAIENNKITIAMDRFDFPAFLDEIVELFSLKAKEKHLEFIAKSDNLPKFLNGDKKRIRQILSNLLNNAVKYTERGEVTLTVRYRIDRLTFIVTDTGCGISKIHHNQIFSPFIQIADNGYAKEGIGIGLTICKELTKLMKGNIVMDSEPGVGSRFEVSLPISRHGSQISVGIDDEKNDISTNKINVLIADDNEINLLLLSNLLDREHCSVDSAFNGKEALNLINRNRYHLAFIDLNMPVINGIELVKRLRKQHNTITMIAVSAYADSDKIREALDAGFDNYLTKPIDPEQINGLIRNAQLQHA
ncbi:MAG: response regulator [Gammaproteobacteria bacterium]